MENKSSALRGWPRERILLAYSVCAHVFLSLLLSHSLSRHVEALIRRDMHLRQGRCQVLKQSWKVT